MKSLQKERARDITESVIAAPEIPLTPPVAAPLTIISTGTDDDINAVAAQVQVEKRAHDSLSVIECLDEAIATPRSAFNTLDLVGHSIPDENYLRIGQWVIAKWVSDTDRYEDPNDGELMAFAKNQLGPRLAQLNMHSLRLVGCETATTHRGFATMQLLAAALNASVGAPFVVYGTNTVLDAHDFGPDGLVDESMLHPSNAAGPAQPVVFTNRSFPKKQVPIPLASQILLAEPLLSDASEAWPISILSDELARQIWSLIDPEVAWSFPGLLALPKRELLMPIQSIDGPPAGGRAASVRSARGDDVSSNLFYRMQILLGHRIVRVFPSETFMSLAYPSWTGAPGGLVYRVSDPARLAKLVP
jgi:hypothetical protein